MMRSMVEIAKGAFLTALAVALVFSAGMRSILLPFAFALLLARWADRPVSRLAQQLPRWLAALIILTVSGLLLCCILLLLIVKLWQDIPAVLSGAQDGTALWTHLEHFTARLPAFLRGGLEWLLAQLQTQSSALRTHLTETGTKWAADTAAALPGALFAWGVALLASFYAAADWKRVKTGLLRLLPQGWEGTIRRLFRKLGRGAMGWLRVQGRLMCITFGLLGAGFFLLHIPGGWTLAVVIALADALPFFGSGIFLVPWAVLMLARGQLWTGGGLIIIWVLVSICRSVLEPRFLGKQAGASPLVTLLVMYAGLRLFGIPGLILGPITLSAVMAAVEE